MDRGVIPSLSHNDSKEKNDLLETGGTSVFKLC